MSRYAKMKFIFRNSLKYFLWFNKTEKVKCVICNKLPDKVLFKSSYPGINIMECSKCGLKFLNRRPNNKWYNYFYSKVYRKGYLKSIESNYFDNIPESHYEEWLRRAENIANTLKNHKNKAYNILEVGAAHGLNLKIAAEKTDCANKYALEIDKRWHSELNKQNIQIIDNLEIGVDFDVIILSHVLEHFTNPLNELKNLDISGIIYIEVPNVNYDTNLQKRFNIAHTFYFDEPSLVKICEMAGLRILEKKCNEVIRLVCCAQ